MQQRIKIDINDDEFQQKMFSLEKNELFLLLKTLKKISQLNWDQLYSDNGLKWEKIISKQLKSGEQLYSFRFSQKYRATALRQEKFLRMLMLHTDHDSAYK